MARRCVSRGTQRLDTAWLALANADCRKTAKKLYGSLDFMLGVG